MQKSLFFLVAPALSLTASLASAQNPLISLSGTSSAPINAGSSYISTIRLTISGANSIGDIESVNALLATPASGASSGASYFTISSIAPASPFNLTNANPATPASFTVTGDSANSGSLVSSTADVGSNAPAGSNPVASSGTTTITVETLTLSSAANTPAGTYNFFFTSGGAADLQGTFVDNMANATFGVNSTPTFTVTIVPEPTTWALVTVGAIVLVGAWQRRRQSA